MTDLEALIAELSDNDTSDGRDTVYCGARTVLPIARELVAARKVVEAARWIKDHHTFDGSMIDAAPDLTDALAAHDAATSAQGEGDGT